MHRVIGDTVYFKTRFCNDLVVNRVTWDRLIHLGDKGQVIREIIFWRDNLIRLNSKSFAQAESTSFDLKVNSDASDIGIGVVVSDGRACHRSLEGGEHSTSPTYRELLAILHGLHVFGDTFVNKRIHWFTNNYAAPIITRKGSAKMHLHELSVEIASACEGFSVLFTWIPREANVTADLLSKYVDADGWEISPDIFLQLDRLWGHFTLDVFASAHNAKAKCFLSKFHEIGSAGVDAFIHSWSGHNCWIIPPPHFRNSSCHRKTHVMSKAY